MLRAQDVIDAQKAAHEAEVAEGERRSASLQVEASGPVGKVLPQVSVLQGQIDALIRERDAGRAASESERQPRASLCRSNPTQGHSTSANSISAVTPVTQPTSFVPTWADSPEDPRPRVLQAVSSPIPSREPPRVHDLTEVDSADDSGRDWGPDVRVSDPESDDELERDLEDDVGPVVQSTMEDVEERGHATG